MVKCDDSYQMRRVFIAPDGNNYLLEPANFACEKDVVPVTGTIIFKIIDMRPGPKRKVELF